MALVDRFLTEAPNLLPRIVGLVPGLASLTPRRPVFLVGCGRSGKTVLGKILGRHPALALFPGEANPLWHPELYPWRQSPGRFEVPPIWFDPATFADGTLVRRTGRDTDLLRGTFGLYQRIRRRPLFLNESALTSVLIPYIMETFQRPLLIHLVRDGRAVAPAWALRQHRMIESDPAPYHARDLPLDFDGVLDRCAGSWAWQVSQIAHWQNEGVIPDESLLELSYEAFCANPSQILETICSFLEVDPAPLTSQDLSYIENRNATDAATLTSVQKERIEGLMGRALARHGYLPSKS